MELSFSRKVNTGLIWKIQYARSFRYEKWEHTNSINRQPMKWYIMFLKPLKLKWKKQFTPHEMRLSDGKKSEYNTASGSCSNYNTSYVITWTKSLNPSQRSKGKLYWMPEAASVEAWVLSVEYLNHSVTSNDWMIQKSSNTLVELLIWWWEKHWRTWHIN